MVKQALMGEFMFEAENTRKLLQSIPDEALNYQAQEDLWTIGQMASHVAEIYNWYDGTFNQDDFDMGVYSYDKGDISRTENIVQKFEENFQKAKEVLENSDESTYFNNWTMSMGGQPLMPAMPRVNVVRSFLYNHLYHHRGELIAYLRASGHKVPGLYGPTKEESNF